MRQRSVPDPKTDSLDALPDTPDVSEQNEYSDVFMEAELVEDFEDESASVNTSTPQLLSLMTHGTTYHHCENTEGLTIHMPVKCPLFIALCSWMQILINIIRTGGNAKCNISTG